MIGQGDNAASPRPSRLTATVVTVTLQGRPSDNQVEFGIPLICDGTCDRLCLEITPLGNFSPEKESSDPITPNSDTTPGLAESSADFIKSAHYASSQSQEKSDDEVQDKSHSVEATSDGSVQCTTRAVGTATAERGHMADTSIDVCVAYDGCPGVSE